LPPPAGGGYNVYRSADEGASWAQIPSGTTWPPSTMTSTYDDLAPPAGTLWYRLRAVNSCQVEGP
jgi:hypothetical protein